MSSFKDAFDATFFSSPGTNHALYYADGGYISETRDGLVAIADFLDQSAADRSYRMADVVEVLFKYITPTGGPHARTAWYIAQHIDNGLDGTNDLAYHNRLHFGKVMVNAFFLCLHHNALAATKGYENLTNEDIADVVLAAAAHDTGYEPGGNKGITLRLEKKAIGEARRIATRLGYPDMPAFKLILATDLLSNPSPAHAMRQHYDRDFSGKPTHLLPVIPELADITRDRKSVLKACILQDADVLGSLLSKDRMMAESARIAKEIGNNVTVNSLDFFLNTLLQGRVTTHAAHSLVGRIFDDIKATLTAIRPDMRQVPLNRFPQP
jgi:hypothetical protein